MTRPENPAARERLNQLLDRIRKNPDMFDALVAHLQERFAGGDRRALADMIYYCALLSLALPGWAAEAFATSYQRFRRGEIDGWAAVLGNQGHMRTLKTSSHGFSVWERCRQLHRGGHSIDEALFEKVGIEFGIKKTKCSELYYQQERLSGLVDELDGAACSDASARK